VDLSETGRKQAEAVARRLRAVRIDALFASPLARCQQTAAPITEVTGRKPSISEDIKECHFGEWEDLAITQVLEKWPEELQRWATDDIFPPPGGESWRDLTERTKAWFYAALERYEGRTVLAVTHGGPIMALVRDLMQIPRATMDGFLVETASLSVLNVRDGRRRLRLWNDTTHLSEPLLETQGLPGYGPTFQRS
jgi:ribonuclease H / adenosylcobalamin/alpha-ribazole phosphatase